MGFGPWQAKSSDFDPIDLGIQFLILVSVLSNLEIGHTQSVLSLRTSDLKHGMMVI